MKVVLVTMARATRPSLKLRPALVLASLPGPYQQWLVCGISSKLERQVPDWDELLTSSSPAFAETGLHSDSLIRLSYIEGVSEALIRGVVGGVEPEVVARLCGRLARHLQPGSFMKAL